VLRIIFGAKRDEVTGEWRKLNNVEVNDPYCSPNILRVIKSRRMKWMGHEAQLKEGSVMYRVFMEKLERKRQMGRPRRR
jgi:hypothetical protein